jgi:hypothetical protein
MGEIDKKAKVNQASYQEEGSQENLNSLQIKRQEK